MGAQAGEAKATPPNPDSPPPVPSLPGKVSGGVLGNVAFDLHSKLCDFVLAVTFGLIATALGILIKWDWHTSLGSDAFEILFATFAWQADELAHFHSVRSSIHSPLFIRSASSGMQPVRLPSLSVN
ncbi:MAG: hypothetical protein WCC32_05335 [Terriglobales bacterium]